MSINKGQGIRLSSISYFNTVYVDYFMIWLHKRGCKICIFNYTNNLMINNLTRERSVSQTDPTTTINNEDSLMLSHFQRSSENLILQRTSENLIPQRSSENLIPQRSSERHKLSSRWRTTNQVSSIINSSKCKNINPLKSFLDKRVKVILQEHIIEIRSKRKLTQWMNSDNITKWFNNIEDYSIQVLYPLW